MKVYRVTPSTVYRPPSTVHRPPSTVYRPPSTAHRPTEETFVPDALEPIAQAFRTFAVHCRQVAPLYERLSLGIADDAELLALASQVQRGQPPSNMLLAAAHYLLLGGVPHPLAAHYPSVGGSLDTTGDPFPLFRAFCLAHRDAISALLATRMTQTNEVRRCAYLMPTFAYVARLSAGQPLALVEIGASAGLNLCWDRYGYDYGDGRRYGNAGSPVVIESAWHGSLRPSLPEQLPPVAFRLGIDLNPLDTRDPDAARWLQALVWPEKPARHELLRRAIALVQAAPPPLLAGDALELLPEVLASVPPNTALCVYHSHVTYQFARADRERLAASIAAHAAQRDLYYVQVEHHGIQQPPLVLTSYAGGAATTRTLAICNNHGYWVEWRG